MKRIIAFMLLITLCCMLAACGAPKDTSKYDGLVETIKAVLPDKSTVKAEKGGWLSVTVNIPDSVDFSQFGTIVYRVIEASREALSSEGSYDLRINKLDSKGNTTYYTRSSESANYCKIFDCRKDPNKPKETVCKTVDDLAAEFPALQIRLKEERNLTREELAIYDAVMAALDAEPNKEESEIFAELAPSFDMTGESLAAYVNELMSKAYSN